MCVRGGLGFKLGVKRNAKEFLSTLTRSDAAIVFDILPRI